MVRTSVVNDVRIHAVSNASCFVVGDSRSFDGKSLVLAVKREVSAYRGDEGALAPYPTYRAAIPSAPEPPPIEFVKYDENPRIRVGRIDLLGVASASLVQIGHLKHIRGDSRTKQFRQLFPETAAAQGGVPRRVYAIAPAAENDGDGRP
ncbi:spore germination protein GerPE [Paenibacillus sp. TRM 82003]|nr:spore germination protein GerPE [Paenibacillus sp. TRM 82003]